MSATGKRLSAIEQFRSLPEVKPALELYGGRIIQKMSPKLPHSVIQGELYTTLNLFSRPKKIGRSFIELRCEIGGNSFVFDIAFFRQDRLPVEDESDDRADVTDAPDLVVEILSPGQTVGELKKKIRAAIRRGVKIGWLVTKPRKQVWILRSDYKPKVFSLGDVLSGEDILPGFVLPVAEIFGWSAGD